MEEYCASFFSTKVLFESNKKDYQAHAAALV
jgi:hypothetical protein